MHARHPRRIRRRHDPSRAATSTDALGSTMLVEIHYSRAAPTMRRPNAGRAGQPRAGPLPRDPGGRCPGRGDRHTAPLPWLAAPQRSVHGAATAIPSAGWGVGQRSFVQSWSISRLSSSRTGGSITGPTRIATSHNRLPATAVAATPVAATPITACLRRDHGWRPRFPRGVAACRRTMAAPSREGDILSGVSLSIVWASGTCTRCRCGAARSTASASDSSRASSGSPTDRAPMPAGARVQEARSRVVRPCEPIGGSLRQGTTASRSVWPRTSRM
jgi:hypothetical protein